MILAEVVATIVLVLFLTFFFVKDGPRFLPWLTSITGRSAGGHIAEVLPIDMWEYFRAVPDCTAEYWSLLVDGVRELWNERTVAFEDTGVAPQQRLMGWFVAQDRREDLESLLEWIDGRSQGMLGQVLIRCNNVLWISGEKGAGANGGEVEMRG